METSAPSVSSPIVDQVRASVPELCAAANRCQIWDPDSYNQAADLAKFISESLKTVEEERKRITAPLNDSLRAVNKLFKGLSEPLDSALSLVKGQILRFQADEKRRADEQAAKLAASAPNLAAVAPAPAAIARGDFGSVSTQTRWTFRVKDISLVPPTLLQVDGPAVNKLIRDGVREIPGLEIFSEQVAVVR